MEENVKNIYLYTFIIESLCCTSETNTKFKNKQKTKSCNK